MGSVLVKRALSGNCMGDLVAFKELIHAAGLTLLCKKRNYGNYDKSAEHSAYA